MAGRRGTHYGRSRHVTGGSDTGCAKPLSGGRQRRAERVVDVLCLWADPCGSAAHRPLPVPHHRAAYPGCSPGPQRRQQIHAAFIEQATETDTPLVPFYNLFKDLVPYIAGQAPRPATILAFEMKFLAESGLRPNLAASPLNEGTRHLLDLFVRLDWPAIARIVLSDSQLSEARLFLNSFITHHFGKTPRGRDEALAF